MKRHQMPLDRNMLKRLREHSPEAEKILADEGFRKLRAFPRHGRTNTYDHSVRVAHEALRLSKRLGVDQRSAVRVGLLHDMCYVNYYENRRLPKHKRHPGMYAFYHPEEAAENARQFGLSEKELHAIRAHMFPLAMHIPKNRLGLVLTLSDKKVSVQECTYALKKKLFHRKMEMN